MTTGRRFTWAIAAAVVAAAASGCKPPEVAVQRHIGSEVTGALSPAALREAYKTPAFVVRDVSGGRRAAVQDTDLAADSQIDDANLLVFVEGSGDSIEGFRWTSSLICESSQDFAPQAPRLLIVVLKWSKSANAVAEHLNHPAQEEGARLLGDMLEVHRVRHGGAGHVSLIGFSAGSRVIHLAYVGATDPAAAKRAAALAQVDDIAFVGSSVGYDEVMPFGSIRGRFINFINARDTHFGDRAAYVAPAGEKADPLKLVQQATIHRRPRFGASVAGFRNLPLLTAVCQFDAIEALERSSAPAAAREAFKMVNVCVPPELVAYDVFGSPLKDDDLDDFVNLAPNHYIMTGRGAGGRTDLPSFRQYSAMAAEFVRDFLAAAALRGRLDHLDLKAAPKGANWTGLPTIVPWAIFTAPEGDAAGGDKKNPTEGDKGKPADAVPAPARPSGGPSAPAPSSAK